MRNVKVTTNRKRKRGAEGQSLVIVALAFIGLMAILALALDGAMVYWNQRRAQNGADAAVIAATSAMVTDGYDKMENKVNICVVAEDLILAEGYKYAGINEVPEGDIGNNVRLYYLTWDYVTGKRVDMLHDDGTRWELTGGKDADGVTDKTPPCNEAQAAGQAIVGLHVETDFPQQTFIAGLIGIQQTNVTTHAYSIWEHHYWCTDFSVYGDYTDDKANSTSVDLTGSNNNIKGGGIYSGNCFGVSQGGKTCVQTDKSVQGNIKCDLTALQSALADPTLTECTQDDDIQLVAPYAPLSDIGYAFEDFAPGGSVWNDAENGERFYFDGDMAFGKSSNTFYSTGLDSNGNAWTQTGLDGKTYPKDGLYTITGNVDFNSINDADGDKEWRVTIATHGTVDLGTGGDDINFISHIANVLIFSDFVRDPNNDTKDIKVSGNENIFMGLILAPEAYIDVSGSYSDFIGMIMGDKVSFSGSDSTIVHRPEFCPVDPPRIRLVK
jgi:hypothetical protein